MIDIVFCSVPGTFTARPVLAPAVLKSCAQQAGFQCSAIDLNIEVMNMVERHPKKTVIEDFFKLQRIHPDIVQDIGDMIEYCANRIISSNCPQVGLSLLTQDNQFFAIWLCYHLKTIKPELKILIGGSGIKNFITESTMSFAQLLKEHGYIDDYINGDGEHSIVEYLQGNRAYAGINSGTWTPITDLNALPFPDFDDYDFAQYTDPGIPICDSRGCVRTCEFCDIIEHWKRYQYRTAENIFAEMQHQIKKYNITRFYFYNSLTNGNMKQFQRLLDLICDYNQANPHGQISWDGYFIVRNAQQHPETFWQKIKKSNGALQLGIESVVQRVRVSLGKNFTNADIDYHLEMAQKYRIRLLLLLIVAYPTETLDDFEFTKQWFRERRRFAPHTITSVVCSLAAILPNTELQRKQKSYGIVSGSVPTVWMIPETDISTQDRLIYQQEIIDLLRELNMNPDNGGDTNVKVTMEESTA
jgi:hypothetical protein